MTRSFGPLGGVDEEAFLPYQDFMNRKTRLRIRDNKQVRRWKQRTRYECSQEFMTTALHSIQTPLTDEQRYAATQSRGNIEFYSREDDDFTDDGCRRKYEYTDDGPRYQRRVP